MNRTINWYQYSYIFGIPLLLVLSIILLVKSSIFRIHPEVLSFGATFDLILTVPLTYFLLIRKKKIPNISVVSFFLLGIIVASLIIPKNNQYILTQVKIWVVPVVEALIFFVIARKVRNKIKVYKKDSSGTLDFFTAFKEAAMGVLPRKIAIAFTTEISTVYYGFVNWRKRLLSDNEFSYHKNSGTIAMLSVIILIILVETFVMHILIQMLSNSAAWILSILSFYTAVQLFGIMRSMSKRPITIKDGSLFLRYGIFSESTILLENIENIELSSRPLSIEKSEKKLTMLKNLESHNVVISVKDENTISGFYGMRKTYKAIAFYVDEYERFEKELKIAIKEHTCR